ncbi:flagellar basal body rod protein FlgB [Desulfovibrio litoralis]|uniref:Flagellar basal body rod protein FlgB n=1 Tax=Desulfovibrio litoralis DSM 11393 TaxID=1121455 RepID=A0A1M7SDF9_9BACT|nr:flagellar basal body rod protein FlgB [Desulfovibrio litoralis]SHN56515.1 flagellar basal-body rod protein FlgB [Desulfovibrio litoralis DSM 11393]
MKTLFEPHLALAGRVLDMQLERQNVVMSNLANIQTPGYKSKELHFEKELQSALGIDARGKMSRTSPRHLPSVFNPNTFEADLNTQFEPRVIDGLDAVNLDKEMAAMAKNSLQYNTLTTVIKSGYDGVKNIIQEGQK